MNKNTKVILKLAAILALASFAALVGCNSTPESDTSSDTSTADSTPGTQIFQASGVVKGVNKDAGEVAIAHQEIPGLMSAMTMDFKVKDPAMLESVAPGDNVDFELERNGSDLTVNKIIKKGGNELVTGESVFKSNCAECHGDKGAGTEKGLSFLEGHALDHSREDFVKRVREGKEDKMPAFGDKLSEAEIEAVVTYVRDVIQKDVKKKDSGSHQH